MRAETAWVCGGYEEVLLPKLLIWVQGIQGNTIRFNLARFEKLESDMNNDD